MKANKILTVTVTLILLVLTTALPCMAQDAPSVFVTLSNGDIVIAREKVSVTDKDGDGVASISDAISLAHDAKFEGGASVGYSAEKTEFGISLTKLLGIENGGAYGYYVNNASPSSLADGVKDGDDICAYVYTDTVNFTDVYSFFNVSSTKTKARESITLTLFSAGFDENWTPMKTPVSGAVITIDGKPSEIKTDKDGKAVITLDAAGNFIISAEHESQKLVPPICEASVSAVSPDSGDNVMVICLIAVTVAVVILVVIFGRKKHDE